MGCHGTRPTREQNGKDQTGVLFLPLVVTPLLPGPCWMDVHGCRARGLPGRCGTWERGTSFRYEFHSCTVARAAEQAIYFLGRRLLTCSVPLTAALLPIRGPVVGSARRIWQARPPVAGQRNVDGGTVWCSTQGTQYLLYQVVIFVGSEIDEPG